MPNLTVMVDTTGAIVAPDVDYKTHLSDEAVDPTRGGFMFNFDSSNVPTAMFYQRCGILPHEMLFTPSVGEDRQIEFYPINLVSGAASCSPHGGYLGAVDIRPYSIRFFANLTRKFVVSASPGYFIQPIPTNNGSCWSTQVRQVMVIDKLDLYRYPTGTTGVLLTEWDGQMFEVGTVDYLSGTIQMGSVTVGIPHYADSFGPEFNMAVTSNGVTNVRAFPWKTIARLAVQTEVAHRVNVPDVGISAYTENYTLEDVTGIKYATETGVQAKTITVHIDKLGLSIPVQHDQPLAGVQFRVGATLFTAQADGTIVIGINPSTGQGTAAGTVNVNTGAITITNWTAGVANSLADFHVAAAPASTSAFCSEITIRTASAPLRPGSLSVMGETLTHRGNVGSFNVCADLDGNIVDDFVIGKVDYAHGVVRLWFTAPASSFYDQINPPSYLSRNFSFLEIPGVTTRYVWHARTSSLRYNAVSYSYLPLDADLLGIDPVRLPSDGRVPIFRPGGFVVVGHTGEVTATVSNGQTINCARERLSRVRVVGHDGSVIHTGYSANLNAGTVTFSDVSGYSQPVTIQHRIEDMMMTSDVQLNGQLTFTRALTHDYPLGSYVSSALVVNDLRARVSVVFDQASWDGTTWQDSVIGSPATATFNDAQFPIVVTNRGALTERWAIVFTSATTFKVIGEHVGVIGTGSINADCSPINPAAGVPYLTIPALGLGQGWSTGNVLRVNTIGAIFPIWCVRTVQQGQETVTNDNFTILVRGDINTP